jgi:hypothetical protein
MTQLSHPLALALSAALLSAVAPASRKAHTEGSVAPYLAPLMVITYLCRLRGIEAVTLTDANNTEVGIVCKRRKGSKDNVTEWNDDLRLSWMDFARRRWNATKGQCNCSPISAH